MKCSRESQRLAAQKLQFLDEERARTLMRGCGPPDGTLASRKDSSSCPACCSPAIAVTIDSNRHTPSSALSASRRLVKRSSRLLYLPNDTSHTHQPCLPISGEFTLRRTSRGPSGRRGWPSWSRKLLKAHGRHRWIESIFFEQFVLTFMCFSPVYAVSAMSQHPNTAASSSFPRRDATIYSHQKATSQRVDLRREMEI